MTRYNVNVEPAPGEACMAHVAELPGCWVIAEDEAAAIAALPERIRRYRRWRMEHGLPPGGDDAVDLVVREAVTGPRPWQPNGASALFATDRRLLDDEEFDLHLHLLACARADLLRAVHAVPRGAFDDLPPGERRTPRETLVHLADMEEWFLSRIGRRICVEEPDPVRRVVDVRARTIEHLLRYGREDRDLVFVPTSQPSDDPDEMWTLRKVLRRVIEHELEHVDDVQSMAARWSHGTGHE